MSREMESAMGAESYPEIHTVRLDAETPAERFFHVADLHQLRIPEGFLSSLGRAFLQRLYREMAVDDTSFVVAAVNDNGVLGFACGSTNTSRFLRRFMCRAGLRTYFRLLLRMISPSVIKRVFETLLYAKRRKQSELPGSEILNIAFEDGPSAEQVQCLLMAALAAEFHRLQVHRVRITVGLARSEVHAMMTNAGAERVGEVDVHKGETSLVYVLDLSAPKTKP